MKKISVLLREKGSGVWSVKPDDCVYDAIAMMAEKNVGALLVMEDDGKLAGIISERDYARKIILTGRSSSNTPVRDVMSSNIVYAEPSEGVEECMALMTNKHIRHLPVMADGELLGLVSIGDLVKAVIAEQQFVIDQLEHYISGDL